MLARGVATTREEILQDIITRDNTDYLWPDAVNTKASDAIEIDTSILTIEEQIDQVYQLALKKIEELKIKS
jgi:cytidylate kinase